jgi:hypothetical protein
MKARMSFPMLNTNKYFHLFIRILLYTNTFYSLLRIVNVWLMGVILIVSDVFIIYFQPIIVSIFQDEYTMIKLNCIQLC